MPPVKHAMLGGSNSKQWLSCTPSVYWEQSFPEKGSSEAAEEGTLAHAIAEEHLTQLKFGSRVMTPTKYRKHELYKPSMEEYIDVYTDYVVNLYEEAKKRTPDALLLLEEPVDYSNYAPEGHGTSDVVLIADGTMHIVDLKYGKGVPVDAVGNPQLRLYALGALNSFLPLYDIHTVTMHIVQPRLDSITSDSMAVEELTRWGEEYVKPRAHLAWMGAGEYVAGDHCRWCRCKPRCSAYHKRMLEIGELDDRMPGELTDEELGKVLERADEIASWAKNVKEWAQEQALDGHSFPGWKLVAGRANRVLTDQQSALETLTDAGYPLDKITKLVSLTDLEALVGKKKLSELLGDIIVKPAGKPTLAKITDKRPAINAGSDMFTPID